MTISIFDTAHIATGISVGQHSTAQLHNGLALGYLVGTGRRDLAERALSAMDDLRISRLRAAAADPGASELAGLIDSETSPEYLAAASDIDAAMAAIREINVEIHAVAGGR